MPTGKPTKLKHCIICGDEFLPEKPSSKICSKQHYATCPICGKQMLWNTTREVQPCSKECKKEATKQYYLRTYGVDHPMKCKQVQEHHKQSMLEKYGVESPLKSNEIREKVIESNRKKFGTDWGLSSNTVRSKIDQTNLERYGSRSPLADECVKAKSINTLLEKYGVDNAMKSSEVQNKAKSTLIDNYGVDNPMKSDEIAQRMSESRHLNIEKISENIRKSFIEKYGVDNPMQVPEFIDKIAQTMIERYGVKSAVMVPEFRQKMIDTCMKQFGSPWYVSSNEFNETSGHIRISKLNEEFGRKLEKAGIEFKYEFSIDRKSYDIHIDDTNILLEIDPTYTHNIIGNHWNKHGLDSQYHVDKTKLAEENGYRCIHVFDWDDWDKIINMILPKQTIYARNCTIYKLVPSVADKFLQDYHLQGTCRGQLLYLGLVKDNELYQVMTFGKSRYDKTHAVELLRLCTKPGYTVVGGASKLFKFATQDYGLHDIISYCDRSKFNGEVYEKLGMKFLRCTSPQEVWSKGNKKVTANLLRQRGYDQLFGTNYGKGSSNEQLMLDNGWLPVYDCGQNVYEFK